ncbi:MFS transporter [Gordonia sp. ABSL1-1]|uniref:MFS transporter n=1 Tax=Gordonia sp. ABSL1-1 TaxID=3053923 RepID=UPI00257456C5|nr:MFS transporter [Gordonia sp. ABSL1-1]MDL9935985.1 MFS transporter [Gordonia sp. ABSL1-1]
MTVRPRASRHTLFPLYAAGFVTAFGAHSIAASLGGLTGSVGSQLLALGLLLALYDGAEVLLKPVFGTLADRIGPRPVLLGGLIGFAIASGAFVLADNPGWLGLARFAQGAAAAAFSPAASAMVSRLTPDDAQGRAFGSYGAWKGLGYTLGPLLGGALIWVSGYNLLFAVLGGLAAAVAAWAAVVVPTLAPLPRTRQTVVDLMRRLGSRSFLVPTAALAGSTGVLAVGVGFIPVAGSDHGLGPLVTGAIVSLLALTASLVQPRAGRARDVGKISDATGIALGLGISAIGLVTVAIPGPAGIVIAAALIGIGVGLVTPLGFAHLAQHSPKERLGQTMGSAEIGRELGDAGGPLLVGAIAGAAGLSLGLVGLAVILGVVALVAVVQLGNADEADPICTTER